jgi:DNA-binding transcriptional ArsR family regulator
VTDRDPSQGPDREGPPDDETLDRLFFALSDRTRRALLAQLAGGDASVSDLAEPHAMSLQAVMKHLAILASAGLVSVEKTGRVKRCHFVPETLEPASQWVNRYERYWRGQLSALEGYLKDFEE